MEVIRVENISKLYDLGQVGTGTISKDLNRWWASVRGKEDPYARMGQTNDRTKKANKDDSVWALKDINFSINQGEVVGIIGRNGAGKSTLLKIISRITTPTTGEVKIKGRIASLLEVGTGFHPEMTGRENAFMNGTLLGMTRREVQSKLDQIIDFAGVELYIDTPVKRYSSGMQVRLAFAVAAFLEPEILIVDEVLAVGDAEFQKKAIGRMQEVSKGDGRTVLFVSHNMTAVSSLCNRAIVLENGSIGFQNVTVKSVEYYLKNVVKNRTEFTWNEPTGNENAKLISARLIDGQGNPISDPEVGREFGIEYSFESLGRELKLYPNIHLFSKNGDCLFVQGLSSEYGELKRKGLLTVRMWLPENLLNEGGYIAGLAVTSFNPTTVHFFVPDALRFDVVERDYNNRDSEYIHKLPGYFRPKLKWDVMNAKSN